jgi:hypothetical protein
MESGSDIPKGLLHGTAANRAFLDFTGTPVNDLPPLGFGIDVSPSVQTGDEATHQQGAIFDG